MGVYIDMEMPESCGDCRLCSGIADTDCGPCAWCDVDRKTRVADTRQDCPLVEVPPHGRLIDADAFIREIDKEVAKFVAINQYDSGLRTGYRASKQAIQLLPTIIPAEEGD